VEATPSLRVCGCSPQNRRVSWLLHTAKTQGSAGRDEIQARLEALRWGTRGGIVELVSNGSKTMEKACPMGISTTWPYCSRGVCVFLLSCRGSVVICLHRCNTRGF
jgi:hypothetical protein